MCYGGIQTEAFSQTIPSFWWEEKPVHLSETARGKFAYI